MTNPDTLARTRWLVMVGTRLAGAAGALFGLILISRAHEILPKIIGVGIVLSAIVMIAIVPLSLAHRWRSPGE